MHDQSERLLTLLYVLRRSERGLTAGQIRRLVEPYRAHPDTTKGNEAFTKQFDRDKAKLRELGVRIQAITHDAQGPRLLDVAEEPTDAELAALDADPDAEAPRTGKAPTTPRGEALSEPVYRIAQEDFALPEITLTGPERAVLSLARGFWRGSEHERDMERVLRKFRADGGDLTGTDPTADPDDATLASTLPGPAPLAPHLGTPTFVDATLRDAQRFVDERRPVSFRYRKPGEAPSRRTVQPWGIHQRGRTAYLAGYDLDRDGVRYFRLSRVEGPIRALGGSSGARTFEIDPDFDIAAGFRSLDADQRDTGPIAVDLAVVPGRGTPLRDDAVEIEPAAIRLAAGSRDRLRLEVAEPAALVARVAPLVPHAVIVAPESTATALQDHLRATADGLRRAAATPLPDLPETAAGRKKKVYKKREDAVDVVQRWLRLLVHVTEHPDARLDETAAHLGLAPEELEAELGTISVVGRADEPHTGYIRAEVLGDRIVVDNAAEIARPARLNGTETAALLIALDFFAATAGHEVRRTVDSVRDKLLTTLASSEAGAPARLSVPEVPAEFRDALDAAIRRGTTLDLVYYVASRDELTERTVTPRRLRLADGLRLDAWCHTAGGERTFAVEHIRALAPAATEPTTPAAEAPRTGAPDARGASGAASEQEPDGLRRGEDQGASGTASGQEDARDDDREVVLVLDPQASWLADEIVGARTVHDTHGPGSVTLVYRPWGSAWLTGLLLQHGPHVRAIGYADGAGGTPPAVDRAIARAEEALGLRPGGQSPTQG